MLNLKVNTYTQTTATMETGTIILFFYCGTLKAALNKSNKLCYISDTSDKSRLLVEQWVKTNGAEKILNIPDYSLDELVELFLVLELTGDKK